MRRARELPNWKGRPSPMLPSDLGLTTIPNFRPPKPCRKCGIVDYTLSAHRLNRHDYICMPCLKEYQRRWAALPAQRQKAHLKNQTPNERTKRVERKRRRIAADPLYALQVRVQVQVKRAVQSGMLARPAQCSKCGSSGGGYKIEAHHENYSKPYDVIWLCLGCHRTLHADLVRNATK